MRTAHTLLIAAPVERVWRALTDPADVERWAGVTGLDLPPTYPSPGDYARWLDHGVVLHDYIVDVIPHRLLLSRLTRGREIVLERYDLRAAGNTTTRLRATCVGHAGLAHIAPALDTLRARVREWHVQNR